MQTARLNLNGDDTSAQGPAASEDVPSSSPTTPGFSIWNFFVIQFVCLALWLLENVGKVFLLFIGKIVYHDSGHHQEPDYIKRVLSRFVEDVQGGDRHDSPKDMKEIKGWKEDGFAKKWVESGDILMRQKFYVVIKLRDLPYDVCTIFFSFYMK